MAEYFPAPGRNHLFVPGPTNIPERVMQAMNRNNEDHRSPAFPVFSKALISDVKRLFKSTKGTCFIIPTTGSGGWESALTNTLSPGDKILTYRLGQFSHLWIGRMTRLNFEVEVVDLEWGSGVDLEQFRSKISADRSHSFKAVCIVHNETSTAVTNDIGGMRRILDSVGHPALLLVDAVSSIAGLDFRMDEWKVDVALTGSQKALSMPCGLGILCASPKALEAAKSAKSLRVFFDWGDYLSAYKSGTYWPYTPSIQLLYGLRAALDMIFEEGLDCVIARHHRFGEATRLAVKAWGLKLCTTNPMWYSDTVTSVLVPQHIDSGDVVKLAWKKYNLSLGVGLGDIAGKAFRIGHIGHLNELQLLGALAGVELVLNEVGVKVPLGSGVVAAGTYLSKSTPLIVSRL
ncbi:alanine-glyoxylate transaminase / serine-glyoxylate transaminase / serine-pyruvate transaminase [Marchantia polymorpha subsp. ruderalis]|uniref:alanine--glyoxylate transaminase n=2 Tax=Marchantia polymorpha TaxID=3197 RepID=A0AAF6B4W2_MARPO|nr:hypothetical protein MARPO_0066s0091 [Marchantia polymorpha]BBN07046.1 hypothetical protein Mp_4g00500 [Marchantia polymorpha subsp. ruderalis]|eukprot:PTQ36138.1 hypothetical protein MARPO_0066s0091 [Marchantia polymorpha]